MPNNIVQLNEEIIKGQIKELVRGSVEETLNELLEAEAEKLTQAARRILVSGGSCLVFSWIAAASVNPPPEWRWAQCDSVLLTDSVHSGK